VNVLDGDHAQRARLADLAQQSAEQILTGSTGLAQNFQLPADLAGEVQQRPQRARGEQAIARPPRPTGIRQVVLQLLHQGRLADARLPGHQHQPPVAEPRLVRVLSKRR
jgi:hypothetical protein